MSRVALFPKMGTIELKAMNGRLIADVPKGAGTEGRKEFLPQSCGAGLYRYDGKTYTNFTTKDGLVDNTILSMMQDSDNNIWFGGMGVTKYDGKTFTTFAKEDGFTDSDVNSISESPDGTLWFGTRGALFHYDGKTFVNFTEKHGLNFPGYVPTVIGRKGHLWFGGENGVYHYDGKKVRHVFKQPSYSLFEELHGNIWFVPLIYIPSKT